MSLARANPWWRRARLCWSLARGRPIQVAESWSGELLSRAGAVAAEWRPDVAHAELVRMAPYLAAVAGSAASRVLVAQEAAGVAAADLHRATAWPMRLVSRLDLRAWRRFEPAGLREADAVVCYTERDRRALAAVESEAKPVTIPLVVEVPARPLDPRGSEPASVLFVGGFGHPPNVDAGVRLATRIFPAVRAACPEATLRLVGDKAPRTVRRLAGDGVEVTGTVDDVMPYLDRAAVVVAPLRLGGGMRIKVLEALAAGKAVVASPLAAEGIAPGDHLVVADSDARFAEAVAGLLLDPGARVALARRARQWALGSLDWEGAVAAYEALYGRLLSHRRPAPAPHP